MCVYASEKNALLGLHELFRTPFLLTLCHHLSPRGSAAPALTFSFPPEHGTLGLGRSRQRLLQGRFKDRKPFDTGSSGSQGHMPQARLDSAKWPRVAKRAKMQLQVQVPPGSEHASTGKIGWGVCREQPRSHGDRAIQPRVRAGKPSKN